MPIVVAVLAFAAGCGGSGTSAGSNGSTALKVQLNWVPNVEFAGFWDADDLGYYRDRKLHVTFLPGGPNVPNTEQLVAGGGADIGMDTNFTGFVDAVNAGADLVLVGAVFQRSPLAILSRADHPIRSARDMLGKRIGSPQGQQPEIAALFKLNGLQPRYRFVPIGFDVQALARGDVDGMTAFYTNQPLILEQQNIPYVVLTWAHLGFDTYADVIFTRRDYLRKHRDVVTRFLRATQRGWAENARRPELAARLAVRKYGRSLNLSPSEQSAENKLQIPLTRSAATTRGHLLAVSAREIRKGVYPTLRAAGFKRLPDPGRIVDGQILHSLYGTAAGGS